jgi:hypothetical protein
MKSFNKNIILTILFVVIILHTSCSSSKKQYYKDLQIFVTQVEKEYPNYTDKDWENKTMEFDKLSKDRYSEISSDLTMIEKNNINELFDRFEACRDKATILELKNGIKSGIKRAGKFIENILQDSTLVN